MSKILLIDGFALIKVWATGFWGFHISGLIHLLPVIAILALLLGILHKKSLIRQNKLIMKKS